MRALGHSGLEVSPVGIDGGSFGWLSGARESGAMLDAFADAGGNLIYTADHHAGGRSEVMIGSWLRTRADRSRMVVATTIGRHPDWPGLSPRMVTRSTEASLRRLAIEHVDILTLDGTNSSVDIDDTFEAVDALCRAGKVGHVAVLRHSAARVRAMQQHAFESRYPPVIAALHDYSLMSRGVFENEVSAMTHELGIGFVARRPLAHGFLSGKAKTPGVVPAMSGMDRGSVFAGRRGSRVLDRLASIAGEHEVSVARVAAAWAISKRGVSAALFSAESVDEILDLVGARTLALTRSQMAALDAVSA